MNSRKWLDFLFDDQVDGETKVSSDEIPEETSAKIQDLLYRAKELEQRGKSEEARKEYAKLGKPNGRQILPVLMGLKGDALIHALSGAGALGRMLEDHTGITLFALSVIFAYISLFVTPKVIRSILVLLRLLFYRNGNRKTEAFSKGLGCSKNRTREALQEVMDNGLATPGEDGNAPGSGRPSLKTNFARIMTGFLIAVTDLDETALEKECSSRRIEGMNSPQTEENDQIITQTPTVDSITQDFVKLQATTDDVVAKMRNAAVTADKKQAVALEKLIQNLADAVAKLTKAVKEVAGLKDEAKESAEDIDNEKDDGSFPERQAELFANRLKVQVLPRLLYQIINLLMERCNGILEAFQETEGKNSYQLVKEINRKVRLKNLVKSLEHLWALYRLTLKDIDVLATDMSSEQIKDGQSVKVEQENAYDIKTADISSLLWRVTENLKNMAEKLMDVNGSEEQTRKKAASRLEQLTELLGSERIQMFLSPEEQGARFILLPMLHYLDSSCHSWQACWTKECQGARAARKAANAILSEGFRTELSYFLQQLNDYVQQQEEADITSSQKENCLQEDIIQDSESDNADKLKKSMEEAKVAVEHAQDLISLLISDLNKSLSNKRERRNSKESSIPGAVDFLKNISKHLQAGKEHLKETEDVYYVQTLGSTASWISEFLEGRLVKWEKDEEGKHLLHYSRANTIAGSLCTKGSIVYLDKAWERLDGIDKGIIQPGAQGRYIGMDEIVTTAEWFLPGTVLSPEDRCMHVLKLWNQGKDPRDIQTWVEYIVNDEYDRNYGDPSDRMKCCHITRTELLTAFRSLTGMTCSEETLWTIFTKDMGYSGRQCAKLDQVGKVSAHRDEQFRHIQKKREKADPERTLIVSIDTKAFLLLGRLKHDNGKIMCRKDGRVYRVLDHDFALKLWEIYPHGTSLVDDSRLGENAVLRPVGAYCPQDGTGYIALVLGKDTAESVCNLLREVIRIKKKTMPNLDRVLILADGGGANMANGVIWQAELLKLADDAKVILDVSHFVPGCSKHNPVEHMLFSAIANSWKGKPFIDIEHVLGYVNATRNKSLTVQGWFDTRRYQTNAEKKAAGEKILTRAELDRLAGNRITHEFAKGTEMYKWNYVVLPKHGLNATA